MCLHIISYSRHIAFALKHIGKLYFQKQHLVIVQNNHIAGTGFIPVDDGFLINNFLHIKLLPVIRCKRLNRKDDTYIIFLLPTSYEGSCAVY